MESTGIQTQAWVSLTKKITQWFLFYRGETEAKGLSYMLRVSQQNQDYKPGRREWGKISHISYTPNSLGSSLSP